MTAKPAEPLTVAEETCKLCDLPPWLRGPCYPCACDVWGDE